MGSAFEIGFINPNSTASLVVSIAIAIMAIIGGVGTLFGPVVGVGVIVALDQVTNAALGSRPGASTAIYGLLLMVMVLIQPLLGPRLLIHDAPSLGLAPKAAGQIFEISGRIRESGTAVLLVEQDLHQALAIADRGYALDMGRIVLAGSGAELLGNPSVRSAYLGL